MKAQGKSSSNVKSGDSRRSVRIQSAGDITKTPTASSSFLGKIGASSAHGSFMDGMNDETNSLVEKLNYVKEELQITQESFISRERAYKIRIEELEGALAQKRKEKIGWMDADPRIRELKQHQAEILSKVALVQDRFSRVVREQETDLLKAFQARLLDVQAELEMQKSKKDDGAVAYIELSKTKEYDVEKEKVKADMKERQNQALLQANNRLKSQFASREEDRNFLVMQINSARNDNARLRAEYNEHEAESKRLKHQLTELAEKIAGGVAGGAQTVSRKGLTSAQSLQMKIDAEERYKEVNMRLKKLLAEERRSLQQVRQNYNNEIGSRTEIELVLRECVEEVRKEGERRRAEVTKYANKRLVIHDDNDPEQLRRDRERVLELLLSKEQVVSMIYAKNAAQTALSSPTKTNTASAFGPSAGSPSGMDGVVNGLLDLNFGSNQSWTSGSATNLEALAQAGGDDNREDNYGDKLPAINAPNRK